MKKTIGYGFQYGKETLGQAATVYLNGSISYSTKKEALHFLKKARKNGSLRKDSNRIRMIKFTVENEK